MKRRRVVRRLVEAAAVALVAAGIAALGLSQGSFAGFQDRAIDRFFPSAKTDPAIVVVGMDEASFRDFGAPPWPRIRQTEIARQLTAAGASVIVWDVVFFSQADQPMTDGFADALRDADARGVTTILGLDGTLGAPDPDTGLLRYKIQENQQPLPEAASGSAHVKVETADGDGVVRSVPLVVEGDDGRFVPSLSLAAVLAHRGASLQPVFSKKGVQAGGRFVPTTGAASMRLNFAAGLDANPERRSFVSAVDVVNGTVKPERFTDKIVFIGATAESFRDNKSVPTNKGGGMPGVFVHANAANTMLTASYFSVDTDFTVVLWVAFLAFLVALAVLFLPLWVSPILALLLGVAYLIAVVARFEDGEIMNLFYPYAMMILAFVVAVMVRYLTETRHRQRVSKLFAQYVPEAVAQQLVDEGRVQKAAEGERLDVSLFFCDLRGFTALSATLTPQQVREMLNEFYDALTELTLDHRGTVLKFVGDEVFAVFGAPLPVEHHPQVALDCAMAIQEAAPVLSEKLASLGLPAVHFGIGMNSGEVVAAHVGGGRRRQYDIVGDTVNIGSRMCGQADKGDIVMPIDMYRILDHPPPAESMGFVALKNVERPIELMRIRIDGPDDADRAEAAGSDSETAATMGA